MQLESLDLIFKKYNTDKGPYYHNYSRQYDSLLNKYRNNNIY